MTALDWIIVALTLSSVAAGYVQGFLVGAATLVGFAAGLVAGGRLGALLVDAGSQSPYAPLFALLGAVVGGLVLAALLEGLGHGVRRRLLVPGFGVVDGVGGALLSGALALAMIWLAGAVALQTPGARSLRDDIQRSSILRTLNDALPPSGPVLNALARFDPLRAVDGPRVDVGPPRAAIARDPEVRAAADGVVRVRGTACGLGVEGSGWIAGRGAGGTALVVTNAHVVAGQRDTTVQLRGAGASLEARVVAFEAHDDVAVLLVEGLGGRVLRFAGAPRAGTEAAILGFPENGPYDVRPARLGSTRRALTQDAYGDGPVSRSLTALRGTVRPGNSGGPVVDDDGRVVTTVFAATRRAPAGGYGVPNAIVREALEGATGEVPTGPCAR